MVPGNNPAAPSQPSAQRVRSPSTLSLCGCPNNHSNIFVRCVAVRSCSGRKCVIGSRPKVAQRLYGCACRICRRSASTGAGAAAVNRHWRCRRSRRWCSCEAFRKGRDLPDEICRQRAKRSHQVAKAMHNAVLGKLARPTHVTHA